MAKVLNSITVNAPTGAVTADVNDTFDFTGTPGFGGSGGVQRYDFKWEVNDGGGFVTIGAASGLTTAGTNPLVNTNSQTANTISVTCTDAGSYTIRMVGAPTSGGSYTVISATRTVEVSAPAGITSDATWAQAAGSWAATATQSLDATATFAQAAGAWEATATQRLDATASVIQAAAAWDAVAAAPITSEATFAQPAAGWLADVDVATTGITSDATWEQAAAGWSATAGLHLDVAAAFTQAAGSWEASVDQRLDLSATFTQAPAGWAATATAPITASSSWEQVNGWAAEVYAGEPEPEANTDHRRGARIGAPLGPPPGAMVVVKRAPIRFGPRIVDQEDEDDRLIQGRTVHRSS